MTKSMDNTSNLRNCKCTAGGTTTTREGSLSSPLSLSLLGWTTNCKSPPHRNREFLGFAYSSVDSQPHPGESGLMY